MVRCFLAISSYLMLAWLSAWHFHIDAPQNINSEGIFSAKINRVGHTEPLCNLNHSLLKTQSTKVSGVFFYHTKKNARVFTHSNPTIQLPTLFPSGLDPPYLGA